jgi:hypothetical protein
MGVVITIDMVMAFLGLWVYGIFVNVCVVMIVDMAMLFDGFWALWNNIYERMLL